MSAFVGIIYIQISSQRMSSNLFVSFNSTEKVKAHLKTYFDRCQEALVGDMGVDQELSLLCTQCFEVSCLGVVQIYDYDLRHMIGRHTTESTCR